MAYRNLAQGLDTPLLAFDGDRLLARGRAAEVALAAKRRIEAGGTRVLVLDEATARPAEIDFEGSDEETLRFVASWVQRPAPTGPPTREVTLLPRHWEWLDEQPGGVSAALRRLVEAARKSPEDARRRAWEAAYRFVLTMAGDRKGFEEATRALFMGNVERFRAETEGWPPDVRDFAREMVDKGQVAGDKE